MSTPTSRPPEAKYTDGLGTLRGGDDSVVEFASQLPGAGFGGRWAEVGCHEGATSRRLATLCQRLDIFDFEDVVRSTVVALQAPNVVGYGNSDKLYDSYNWALTAMLQQDVKYDFIFLDGAHDLAHDGLAALLSVQLLTPGGYLWLDDCNWCISASVTLGGTEWAAERYTQIQMDTLQVMVVAEILAKHPLMVELPGGLPEGTLPRARVFRKRGS